MRILFLSSVYPRPEAPVRGTFNRDLCQALAERADVRVIAPVSWTDCVRSSLRRHSSVAGTRPEASPDTVVTAAGRPAVPVARPLSFYPPALFRHAHGRWMWRSVRRCVRTVTADFRPDWVLSYWAHPDGEAALRAARSIGCRAGVIVGGSDVLLLTRDRRRCEVISRTLRELDLVVTVSEGLRRRVLELGVAPPRVRTIRQGINPELFSRGDRAEARRRLNLPDAAPVYLWVGRMVGLKRLDLLIAAFAQVRTGHPDAVLCLAGSGPQRQAVIDGVRARGLESSVRLPGPVPSHELRHWYQAASATVLCSDSEGLPNVLRESLSCGTPCVSTGVGSVAEIASPDHSLLVPAGDASALAGAMRQILQPRFTTAAREYRPREWSLVADEFLQAMPAGRPAAPGTFPPEPLPADPDSEQSLLTPPRFTECPAGQPDGSLVSC